MEVQKDFKELLELLNGHKVEYMIVGAYALAYHALQVILISLFNLLKKTQRKSYLLWLILVLGP